MVCVELLPATCTVSTRYSVRMKPVMLENVVAEQVRLWGVLTTDARSSIRWFSGAAAGDAIACEANSSPAKKAVRRTIATIRGIGILVMETKKKER